MSKLQSLDDVIALAGTKEPEDEAGRAWRGALALTAYIRVYGQDIIDTAITDLIADLLHLADASDLQDYESPYDVVDTAMSHYEAERGDGEGF